jgi:hypothetical protein
MAIKNIRTYCLLLFIMLFTSCVRRINPPIREGAPALVVEGMITTDSTPYVVKLSYTGNFTNANVAIDSNQNFINDARVVIKDDAGDSALCFLISPGTYQTTDSNFVGMIGRSYTLDIYLSSGKTYVSTPEKINTVPPIDSVTVLIGSCIILHVASLPGYCPIEDGQFFPIQTACTVCLLFLLIVV